MDELKPCPFCGGKAKYQQFSSPRHYYSVSCNMCGCHTDGFSLSQSDWSAAKNKAANAAVWNRRAVPPEEG